MKNPNLKANPNPNPNQCNRKLINPKLCQVSTNKAPLCRPTKHPSSSSKPPLPHPRRRRLVYPLSWFSSSEDEAPKKVITEVPPNPFKYVGGDNNNKGRAAVLIKGDVKGKGLADPDLDLEPGYKEFVTYPTPEECAAWSLVMLARDRWYWNRKKNGRSVTVEAKGWVVESVVRRPRTQHPCGTCGKAFRSHLGLTGHISGNP